MPPEDENTETKPELPTVYEADMAEAQRQEAANKESAREVYKNIADARDVRLGETDDDEDSDGDDAGEEVAEDDSGDEPLSDTGRESLARDLGLKGELKYDKEGNLLLTKAQAKEMAGKSGERSGLVDDLFRRLAEAGKESNTSNGAESEGARKPSLDEPAFTDEELEPLRESMGDEFADKLKKVLEAPGKKATEMAESMRAERALTATFQSLSGELPGLGHADAIDKFSPTVVALLQTGDYSDLEAAVRAAYSARGGKVKSKRKRVATARDRHLDGQPPELGTRGKKTPLTEKDRQRDFYRRLKGGQSRVDAMRGAGL